jgi:hypothetical protein
LGGIKGAVVGNVIHIDFGQTDDPPCPPEKYAEVISIVAELEPAHAFKVLENALFAVLLAKNGRDRKARWADLREFHRSMRKLFLASQRITPDAS